MWEPEHVYDGERCRYCNVNIYDVHGESEEKCHADRALISFTSQSENYEHENPEDENNVINRSR